jgi:nitrate/nitrite-specific signal transduction histidine kinase
VQVPDSVILVIGQYSYDSGPIVPAFGELFVYDQIRFFAKIGTAMVVATVLGVILFHCWLQRNIVRPLKKLRDQFSRVTKDDANEAEEDE